MLSRSTRRLIFAVLLLVTAIGFARDKAPYQTTKLLELASSGHGFCFVVQLDDIAYLATTSDDPGKNLIVGDPVEVQVKDENIRIKVAHKKYVVGSDYGIDKVKARISVRKRMKEGQQLPSCALAVKVH